MYDGDYEDVCLEEQTTYHLVVLETIKDSLLSIYTIVINGKMYRYTIVYRPVFMKWVPHIVKSALVPAISCAGNQGLFEHHPEKTCRLGFGPGRTQIKLLIYRN